VVGTQGDAALSTLAHELQHAWDDVMNVTTVGPSEVLKLGYADPGEQRAVRTANIIAGTYPNSGKQSSSNGTGG